MGRRCTRSSCFLALLMPRSCPKGRIIKPGRYSTRFLILFKELFNAQSKLILSYYEECEDIHTFRRDKIGGVIWKKYRKGSMLPTTF